MSSITTFSQEILISMQVYYFFCRNNSIKWRLCILRKSRTYFLSLLVYPSKSAESPFFLHSCSRIVFVFPVPLPKSASALSEAMLFFFCANKQLLYLSTEKKHLKEWNLMCYLSINAYFSFPVQEKKAVLEDCKTTWLETTEINETYAHIHLFLMVHKN